MSNKKSIWKWNLLAITAALTATAATASEQQDTLEAKVPFAFSVSRSAHLAPGTYEVFHKGDIWWFRSYDANQVAAIASYAGVEGNVHETPSLTFACLREKCEIRAVHMGNGVRGIQVPARKLSKSDQKELAFINVPLQSHKGETASR